MLLLEKLFDNIKCPKPEMGANVATRVFSCE